MANCCGGKNAGKRISWRRYAAGLSVFLGYHGTMRVLLTGAAIPLPELGKVRDFHKAVFRQDLKEILALEDINVNGRLGEPDEQNVVCAADFAVDGVRTVEMDDEIIPVHVPRIEDARASA